MREGRRWGAWLPYRRPFGLRRRICLFGGVPVEGRHVDVVLGASANGCVVINRADGEHGKKLPFVGDAKRVANVIAGSLVVLGNAAAALNPAASKIQFVCHEMHVGHDHRAVFDPRIRDFGVSEHGDHGSGGVEDSLARRACCRELLDGLGVVNCHQLPGLLVAPDRAGESSSCDFLNLSAWDFLAGEFAGAVASQQGIHECHDDSFSAV